jgi:hypothetical protein
MPNNSTDFSDKCAILGDLWLNYRDDENFSDFVEYNDLGLPLAYLIVSGIVTPTDRAVTFVDETWDLLIQGLEIEDTGFASLDELLDN